MQTHTIHHLDSKALRCKSDLFMFLWDSVGLCCKLILRELMG